MTLDVLPTPPALSRSGVDRSEPLRADTARQAALWPSARVLILDEHNRVPVRDGTLALVPAASVAAAAPPGAVLLGELDGVAYWAVPGELPGDGHGADLRGWGGALDDLDAGLLTTAVALLNWHARAGFCAVCASPTEPRAAGWARVCTARGHEEYPRTDPAIICLIHDRQDEQVLLARQASWPAGRFSVLAGFVEAGESLEACVRREVDEEVGLAVESMRYLGSQPWPFPRSLMLGFAAVADPLAALRPAEGEIAQARWVTRADLRDALARGAWTDPAASPDGDGPLLLPGGVSIARRMLDAWAASSR